MKSFRCRTAGVDDASTILELIQELARFEKLEHEVKATHEALVETLFSTATPSAEVLMAEYSEDGIWKNAGFALYFTSYSTFLAKPGIYLEDLYVRDTIRSRGYGKMILGELARIAVSRGCGRLEWSVLNWNRRARDFYERLGAQAMSEWSVHRVTGEALLTLAKEGP